MTPPGEQGILFPMAAQQSPGECRLCEKSVTNRTATIHLKSCWDQHTAVTKGRPSKWFQIVVSGRHAPGYWLQLQAPGKSKFGDLDQVLRDIWLECCGHLSEFTLPTSSCPPWDDFDEERGEELMGETLASELAVGMQFLHTYDFGTTTELRLRVAAERLGPALEGKIKVLARNSPPIVPCSVCKEPATQLCVGCESFGGASFCDRCAAKHDCGEVYLLPLVNSPRAGFCGYTGPSVEP